MIFVVPTFLSFLQTVCDTQGWTRNIIDTASHDCFADVSLIKLWLEIQLRIIAQEGEGRNRDNIVRV